MLIYRILCALLMAWAVNLALARDEAETMLTALPHMEVVGPIAGAITGFFNLAVRQGWGLIVGFANGIWAGVLTVAIAGVLNMGFQLVQAAHENTLKDFDSFLLLFGEFLDPMLQELPNVPLLVVSLGMMAVVGVITEVIHWLMVRVRGPKGQGSNTPNA